MKNENKASSNDAIQFRNKAETRLKTAAAKTVLPKTHEELLRFVQELEIHQIELEMMNEELQQSRTELELALEQYTDLYDFAPVGYFTISSDGTILKTNLKACEMLGIERSKLLGYSFGLFVSEDTRPTFKEFLQKIFNSKTKENCELSFCVDENQFFAHIEGIISNNKNEVRLAMVDITERKRTEILMLIAKQQYQELAESISDVFFTMDDNLRYTYWNKGSEKLTGIPAEKALGKTLMEIFPDSDTLQQLNETCLQVIETKNPRTLTVSYPGVEHAVHEISVYPAENGITVFAKDITEPKKMEEVLRESEERYRVLFEGSSLGILGVDIVTKRFLFANPSICRMLGYSKSELLQLSIWDIHPKDSHVLAESEFKALVENKEAGVRTFPCIRKDGTVFYSDISGANTMFQRRRCIVNFFSDVTQRKRAEESLKNQNILVKSIINSPRNTSVYALDSNYRYLAFNDNHRLEMKKHYNADIEFGRSMLDYISNYGFKRSAKASCDRALKGEYFAEVNEHLSPGVWYEFNFGPIKLEDGSIKGLYSYMSDITTRKLAGEKLHESEERYRKLVELSPDGVLIYSGEIIQFANQVSLGLFDAAKPADLLGKKIIDLVHPDYKKIFSKWIRKIIDGEKQVPMFELKLATRSGRMFDAELTAVAITLKGLDSVQVIARDITERKKAGELLKQSEKEFRDIFQNAHDAILVLDPEDEIVLEANDRALEIYGFTREEFIGKSMRSISKNPEKGEEKIKQAMAIGFVTNFETAQFRKDGSEIKLEVNSSIIEYKGNKAVLSMNHDITKRKKLEEDIKNSQYQLEQLYQHLNEIREEERAEISREVHDELGQALTALKMDLNWTKDNLENKHGVEKKLKSMMKITSDTIKNVQRISSELRPGILDDLGLVLAIEWYSKQFEEHSGLKCTLEMEEIPVLDAKMALALYRVCQESLTNVIRHANAKNVHIKLYQSSGKIHLQIIDDGIGISDDKINSHESLGLRGMKERLKQFNGKIEIISSEKPGTHIKISIPLIKELV